MSTEKLIQEAKEIFLDESLDDETYKDNLDGINEWASELLKNEAMLEWQKNDVTKEIISQVKRAYIDISMKLANGRSLSEQERMTAFAQQDACMFILALSNPDVKSQLHQLQKEIRSKIASVQH